MIYIVSLPPAEQSVSTPCSALMGLCPLVWKWPKQRREIKRQLFKHIRFSSHSVRESYIEWPFLTATFLTIIVSQGPSLTQMPAPRHVHLTRMLRMAGMTVIVFYRGHADNAVEVPRITRLSTVTWDRGCCSDCQPVPAGTLEKVPGWVSAEPRGNVVNVVKLTIVSVLP